MEKYKNTFSRIAFGLITIMVIQNIFSILLNEFRNFIPRNLLENDWLILILSLVIQYLIAYPVGLIVMNTASNSPIEKPVEKRFLNLKQIFIISLSGFALVSLINILGNLITMLLGLFLHGNLNSNPISDIIINSNPYIMFFMTVILAPIVEEYMFRYFIYKKISIYGDKIYVLFSSLIFGMFHLNIVQGIYAFILGNILALVYVCSGKLKYPILIHMIINLLGGGISIITLTFNNNTIIFLWGILSFVLIIIGLLLFLFCLTPILNNIHFSKGEIQLEKNSSIILNPGMIIFTIIVITTMITIFFGL
ncbi:CPBP family intramembrane glutamic endopeptidase [Miniphocaeibacter halophilus]|uniref:CPBP family intramembrane metalloprotease n=1 Tax=Miniphocaeibacter halophilus TaxID=2931922 RepID=A0AC61MS72_9FIRM|nr:type II CAAX endopeptidase family protein [Miniphocaeibacter halophilus]QQK08452.1 CPBP family intramembrane metalloprotease [Miniphocaeibacter halophilus]